MSLYKEKRIKENNGDANSAYTWPANVLLIT